ncbi:hypothetical protein GINT2_000955 [Glugoides intestinalis]
MYTNKNFIQKKDATTIDLPECPVDSISFIAFNFENSHVAASSWDGSVKLYRLPYYTAPGSNCTLEKSYTLGNPVLSCCFFNGMLLAGLVDGNMVSVDTNNVIRAHDAGIKGMYNYNNQLLITGSFDCTLKFWDLKTTTPVHTIMLPGKVYAMDLKGSFLLVALSDRSVITYDMENINQPTAFQTKFTYSIRSVAGHKDLDSIVVGGIEAKIEIFSRMYPLKKVVFKCHRSEGKLYSVNVLRFSPNNSGVMLSGGSDGALIWVDKADRAKICYNEFDAPITAGEFSFDGKYFIFATGDDWSKGYTGAYIKPSLKMIVVSTVPGIMNK